MAGKGKYDAFGRLVEAGVNAARKESGGSVKSGVKAAPKKSGGSVKSGSPKTQGDNSVFVNMFDADFMPKRKSGTKQQVGGGTTGTKQQVDEATLDEAISVLQDYFDRTKPGKRLSKEKLLKQYGAEKVVEMTDRLVRENGFSAGVLTQKALDELVTKRGIQEAVANVEAGIQKGSLRPNPEAEKLLKELRGQMDVNSRLPEDQQPLTPEQLEQQRKAEAAAAEKQAAADKAREAAEAEVARQRALQEQIAKPSLPVRAFNKAAEALKTNYGNGNVKRTLQTVGALGGLAGGLGGLGWLASSLMSESDEERKAREQAELDPYR